MPNLQSSTKKSVKFVDEEFHPRSDLNTVNLLGEIKNYNVGNGIDTSLLSASDNNFLGSNFKYNEVDSSQVINQKITTKMNEINRRYFSNESR